MTKKKLEEMAAGNKLMLRIKPFCENKKKYVNQTNATLLLFSVDEEIVAIKTQVRDLLTSLALSNVGIV